MFASENLAFNQDLCAYSFRIISSFIWALFFLKCSLLEYFFIILLGWADALSLFSTWFCCIWIKLIWCFWLWPTLTHYLLKQINLQIASPNLITGYLAFPWEATLSKQLAFKAIYSPDRSIICTCFNCDFIIHSSSSYNKDEVCPVWYVFKRHEYQSSLILIANQLLIIARKLISMVLG